jgi:DNA-directed RNA polymerase specialized sigma24 family protein
MVTRFPAGTQTATVISFRNYLFTIVWRKLSNWRRAQQSRLRCNGAAAPQPILEQRPAPERGVEAEWEAQRHGFHVH